MIEHELRSKLNTLLITVLPPTWKLLLGVMVMRLRPHQAKLIREIAQGPQGATVIMPRTAVTVSMKARKKRLNR